MKPKFLHDCSSCKFLGIYGGYDIYLCDKSIIARHGDEGHEYASGLIDVMMRGFFEDPVAEIVSDLEHNLLWRVAMIAALTQMKVKEIIDENP